MQTLKKPERVFLGRGSLRSKLPHLILSNQPMEFKLEIQILKFALCNLQFALMSFMCIRG